MKKLFGEINLTWKKLILFAIISGTFTALMAMIPATRDTSFRDIAISFEWWILFGIIIICNSKSQLDSALKCFIFFLISQPLVYLIQVPFSSMGWNLFGYYRYWFYWTLFCFPMGYIGYYIKKKNWLSLLILSPMIIALVLLGLGYINTAIENFPNHLLTGICCYLIIVIVVLGIFDNKILRLISLSIAILATIIIIFIRGRMGDFKYETYYVLDNYEINLVGKIEVITFTGHKDGDVEIINPTNGIHSIKLSGWGKEKYLFTIGDEENNQYDFEYYYDENTKSVVLNKK